MRTQVSIGVFGADAAGRTLARAFDQLQSAELTWICGDGRGAPPPLPWSPPSARATARFDDLLEDEGLDAVAIATAPAAREHLVRRALDAGKHVLVEPPLAFGGETAEELVRLAQSGNRRLMTSSVLCFHPALRRLKELVVTGRLGELYYLYGSWLGLSRGPGDESVVWTAGADVAAAVLWMLGDEPVDLVARGGPCTSRDAADVAFCHLRFATGLEVELRLSRIEPRPVHFLAAVGSRGMAVFDELAPQQPLTVHETAEDSSGAVCRGDVVSPRLPPADPVRAQCEHFVSAISSAGPAAPPADVFGDGRGGAGAAAVLEALQRSLERGGTREAIGGEAIGESAAPDPPRVIRLPLRSG
jgi:predicted dehydrogenase